MLAGNAFFLLRNAPPASVIEHWTDKLAVPVRRPSSSFAHAPAPDASQSWVDWEQLCVTHKAAPQFVLELLEDTVRLRLLAKSLRDNSVWYWTGQGMAAQRQ